MLTLALVLAAMIFSPLPASWQPSHAIPKGSDKPKRVVIIDQKVK
jgi:hypothetical protein